MKIIDGLKLKGRPAEIPDSFRNDLPELFKELGFKVGAEIGVYRGEFTEKFCRAGLKMYAIDPWIGYKGAGRSEKAQDMQDYNFECAKKTLSQYKDCTLIRKTSMEALRDFKAESLDFVYIDGDHRFPAIAADIYGWYPKVKKGGIISGDDYFCTSPVANNVLCHVKPIVDAFVQTYDLADFYIIGQKDKKPSWIIVKS
ncbi:class I SAM-dependent methyltransferase [Candidatus Daviesbacteria bacterium]|nr:class I SAM-dependent methyltransferase [Candidatus Daviesbacteria bacterium]